MTPTKIRTTLFLLGLCILGGVAALQLLQSVPHATMFYAIGVALVFMILDPFAGLIAYLAAYYIRPHGFIPGFSHFPLMFVIGGAALINMIVTEGIRQRRLTLTKTPQDYLLMWFLLAVVVSHLSHLRVANALSSGFDFVHTVVFYLLITNVVTNVRRLNVVLQILGVLTLWVAIEALVVHYTGTGIGGVAAKEEGRVIVLGFSSDPNYLAGAILLLLPLFFFQFVRSADVGRRLYSAFAIVLMCYAVFLTNSRGGAVTLVVVGTLLLTRTLGLLRGVVLGVVLTAGIYFLGPSRMREINPTEPSAYGRLVSWESALGQFRANPLFGVGSGGAGKEVKLIPHDAFIHTAADLGIFGLFPWVLFVLVCLKNVFFVVRHATGTAYGKLGLLGDALFCGCVGWLVSISFTGTPYYEELYIVAGLCVAATSIFVETSPARFRLIEKRDFGYAAVLIALGLGVHKLVLLVVGV